MRTRTDSTPGARDEDRSGHLARHGGLGEVGNPHRHRPVGGIADVGRHAFAHLTLDHHQQPLDSWDLGQGAQHQRGREVVGQIRHEGPRSAAVGRQEPRGVEGHGVGVDHLGADGFDDRAQHREQVAIHFDRDDLGAGLGQGEGERTEARPDLKDVGPGSDIGEPGDAAHRVRIGHEVLTERPARSQSVGVEERRDVGARMCHQLTVTSITPWLSGANSENSAGERSTTRPGLSASRSSTVQTTCPPLAATTVNTVPAGSDGLAHPLDGNEDA